MALHKKRDFAKLVGLTTGNLTNYITRGNVIMSEENPGYIDDQHEKNQQFIANRVTFLAKKGDVPEQISAVDPDLGAASVAKEAKNAPKNLPKADLSAQVYTDASRLQREKAEAEIERIRSTTRLNELRIQKQEGELIPNSLIKPIMSQLAMSMMSSYKNGANNFVTEIAHQYGLSLEEQTALRSRIIEMVNQCAKDAVADAKKSAQRISDDFIEKKTPNAA